MNNYSYFLSHIVLLNANLRLKNGVFLHFYCLPKNYAKTYFEIKKTQKIALTNKK